MNDAGLEMRPLGLLACGAALLSVALSWTYFFSPIALVLSAVALLLGGVSRTDPAIRGLGNIAMGLAVFAFVVSCATIFVT